jgi:uncharacterized iron-regulated protein
MKKALVFFIFQFLFTAVFSQDKPAYVLYNAKGGKVSYKQMIETLDKTDITLFGEFHNNPISHWLQLETTEDLQESNELILGAEMFEADNQAELDSFLAGKIDDKALDTLARLWPNYKTDYAPLVDFAKDKHLKFVATNIPRRYARLVHKGGFESLDNLAQEEKMWIAPLPIEYDPELPGYKKMLGMMHGRMGNNLPKAQAIKDATMAYFILKNYRKGSLFIHYNGAYHSENYEGILHYLKKKMPDLKYATITTVSQKDVSKLSEENKNRADFIICVVANMTTTY